MTIGNQINFPRKDKGKTSALAVVLRLGKEKRNIKKNNQTIMMNVIKSSPILNCHDRRKSVVLSFPV